MGFGRPSVRWRVACLLFIAATPARGDDAGGFVPVGAGGYVTALPAGAKGPQAEIFRTPSLTGPMPTNDWWSSLAWMTFSERQYPHPLAVAAEKGGLRVYYPGATITANKDAIFAFMPA